MFSLHNLCMVHLNIFMSITVYKHKIFFFSEGNTNFLIDYFVHTNNFYYCFYNKSILLIYDCSSTKINSCTHVHEEEVYLFQYFDQNIYGWHLLWCALQILLFILLFDLFNVHISKDAEVLQKYWFLSLLERFMVTRWYMILFSTIHSHF